jgi:ATP-binding cassette subfamily C protein CydC/ATP-binding cassette subfamily C protein CydCD
MADLLAARGERSVVVVSHRPEGLAEAHGIMDLTRTAVAPRDTVPDAVPTLP